ncbi:MAG: hypothetical protein ACTSP1_18085 [Candidatus Freyarchaeota archaeon]
MVTKVRDLTVEELRALISSAVKDALEDLVEDLLALSSEEYMRSVEEARRDYKEGRVKRFEEVFDV